MSNSIRKNLLRSDNLYATTGLAILIDENGYGSLYAEPETIQIILERSYGDLPEETLNKINAARTIITSDSYYISLSHFVILNNTLFNGNAQDFIANMAEICWGVTEADILFPIPIPDNPLKKISSSVYEYILKIMELEGLMVSPRSLGLLGITINILDESLNQFVDDPDTFNILYNISLERSSYFDKLVQVKLAELEGQLIQAGFKNLNEISKFLRH